MSGPAAPLVLEGLGCGALRLVPEVVAEGAVALTLEHGLDARGVWVRGELEALDAVTLRAINFELNDLSVNYNSRFFRHGLTSWTPSASFPAHAPPGRPWSGSFAVANHPVDSAWWRRRRAMISHGFGLLGDSDAGLLVGHSRAEVGLSEIVLIPEEGPRLFASLDYGGKRLARGERLALEPLRLAWGAPHALLDAFVEEVAEGEPATARLAAAPAPVGWCSWYHFYTRVRHEDVVRNAAALRALPQLGVGLVQLDDGYQTAVGDWRSMNHKFERGLGPLARDVAAMGFQAGLWTAPFMAGRRSQLYRQHPDWILRRPDGPPVDCGVNPAWRDRLVGLDLSHPAALDWLRDLFSGLAADGYDFFKLDFLYAALRHAARHDPAQSPVQSYRAGLRAIREAVGEGRFLLGCGAPLLPSVGLVDGMRVSADVRESWGPGLIGWVGQDCGAASLLESARNNLTRAPFHRRWWLNDPDCLLVRDQNTALKLHEVRLLVTVAGMSGGLGLVSDDMAAVPEDRRALLSFVLPPTPLRPRTPDLFERPFPERFELNGADRRLVALINWGPSEAVRALPAAEVWRFDAWKGCPLPDGPVLVPSHGVAACWETPRSAHPRLVGTSAHLTAPVDGRLTDTWGGGALTLACALSLDVAPRLWIALPAGFAMDALPEGLRLVARWEEGVVLEGPVGAPWRRTLRFVAEPVDQAVPKT